jgi:hypothetical protein
VLGTASILSIPGNAAARSNNGKSDGKINGRDHDKSNGYRTLIREINKVIQKHGEIVEVRSEKLGRSGKVMKILIFESGVQKVLFLKKKSDRVLIAVFQGKKYKLVKTNEQLSSFSPPVQQTGTESTGDVSTSAVQRPPVNDGWVTVEIGESRRFHSQTHSRARTKNDWMGHAEADTSGTELQLKTKASIAGIPGAYAQTWVSLDIDSQWGKPENKHCNFTISTDHSVAWSAATLPWGGGSGGAWKIGAYVYDYNADDWLEREIVADGMVGPVDLRKNEGSKDVEIGVNLEAGNKYGVGLYAGANSASILLSTASIDMSREGDYNGFADWDWIDMEWS